ncbi:MAG: universal stress protein [Acidobacteria bacterium]|nr:universal stress protein [Acidobacteriota bacterium]MCI0624914.1 universal stress protein [Acidobacteriota bacterium]
MIKFKRILFPTDFSPAAAHALDYAISLSLEHEATLHVVHVIEDIGFNSPFTLSAFPTMLEYHHGLDEKVKGELQKVISPQLKRQLSVQEHLAKGKPFVEIVRLAREVQADLIVIPTHCKPGPKHTHLGSTSELVVRKAACPVLVIRHPEFEFVMP